MPSQCGEIIFESYRGRDELPRDILSAQDTDARKRGTEFGTESIGNHLNSLYNLDV